MTGRAHRRFRQLLLGVTTASTLSCVAASAPDSEWRRASDDLLTSPQLQAVVEAGIRRDTPALLDFLASDDPGVRARAAFALGSVQDPAARPALLERIADPDPRVRADAAFALGQLPDTIGTRELVTQLRVEEHPDVRVQLIQAVGRAGGRGAIGLLLRTDVRESEHAVLALALARIGNRGVNNALAVERLLELMESPDATVRRNAAFYFGRSASPQFWRPVVPRLRERLEELALDDQAATWLLRALAKLNDPLDTDAGRRWLAEGTDWRTRHAAAELLQNRQAGGAVKLALAAALDDPSPHVRGSAARGIAFRERPLDDSDQLFLKTWIDEHPDDVATIAALLPARVRKDATQVLEWGDQYPPDSPQRAAVIEALSVLPGLAVVEREFEAVSGEGPAARAALTALEGRIPSANQERLARILDAATEAVASGRPGKVQLGLLLLAHERVAPLGAIPVIADAWEGLDPTTDEGRTIGPMLMRALGVIGGPEAEALLLEGVRSTDPDVQAASVESLAALTGDDPEYEPVERALPGFDWNELASYGRHPVLHFEVGHGEFTVELDAEQAPLTAQTLIRLAEAGRMDGVPFHRVVPAFVVQGGDVSGAEGFGAAPVTIRTEFTQISFDRGTLGMASSGKDTEGSQFFITHLITPHLDGGYTAFGRVRSGQDVIDAIEGGDAIVRVRPQPGGGG